MARSLTRQVLLASLLVGAILVIAAFLGFRSVLQSSNASTHLGEHVLAEIEADHRFQLSLARAIGEVEAFARGQEEADRQEVQELLTGARQAVADLDALAAEEAADDDNLDSVADLPTISSQERVALIERTESLVADLTTGDTGRRAEVAEEVEQLHETIDQLVADAETRNTRSGAQAVAAVMEANRGAGISLGVAFGLLVLVTVLAVLLVQWQIIRPLRTLHAATTALATNTFAHDVPVTSNTEIGSVQQAFNTMAGTIRAQTQDLEQQVVAAETARAAAEAAKATIQSQLAEIEAQRTAIREMSVPILPVSPTTLVMPLIGSLDTKRLQEMQSQALTTPEHSNARYLLLDITGVPVIDTQVAKGLLEVVQAARLLGVEVVLVGVRPEVAQTMAALGISFGQLATRSSLEGGITYVQQRTE